MGFSSSNVFLVVFFNRGKVGSSLILIDIVHLKKKDGNHRRSFL